MLFFVVRLSHYCEFRAEHAFPNNHFLDHRSTATIYCQMRFKLFQHYLLFSVSVAVGRRFNAASEKKITLRKCLYIFPSNVS